MTSHEKNQNKWREFCFDLIEGKKADILEEPYQEMIEQGLRQLNWSKADGEICPKERIKIGSNNRLEPDITLKISDKPVFVIEVKRPSNRLNNDQILQLVSYMRQRRVPFGLYIGDRIALFYDDAQSEPIEVWGLEVDSDADEGWRFVDLFGRNTFSAERLDIFCKERQKEISSTRCLQELLNSFDENGWDDMLRKLVTEHLVVNDGFDEKLVEKILISYTFKAMRMGVAAEEDILHDGVSEQESRYIPETYSSPSKTSVRRDYTKYSIDGGKHFMGKRHIVREIVIRYLTLHPSNTYRQLKCAFPDGLQGSLGVIRSMDELQIMAHDVKDLQTRFWMSDDMLLTSSDGIKFAVCNQWGRSNIPNIFRVIAKWGWNILNDKEE